MDHDSPRRGSHAEQYEHSMICLGPLSPPERTYSNESNSAMSTPTDWGYTTPWNLSEIQSPHSSVTASTPQDQTTSTVGPKPDEKTTARKKKKEPVLRACKRCRARKTKCSGQRPVCKFCHERGTTCEWDSIDGLTRNEDLKFKLEEAETILDDNRVVVNAMQFGDDQVSTLLLVKLRIGVPVADLAEAVRTGTLSRF